ncbi:pentatricopeptide repeat-containing protein [Tanacetum coccineum]|uniref:Pentatricopeptide repeat-containing protein n=1 Tax=Tanacetum coccineum TaxID=301880 RepID=A0ABQ5HVX1_9ASTR
MIHGDVVKMGFDVSSVFVGNSLLSFYGKCGLDGVDYACKVFADMSVKGRGRDVVSWNTMIGMYMDSGQVGLAVSLFEEMTEKSVITWNCVITGLAKNGKMEFARSLFDKMPVRDEVSWNCLISGYVKAGDLTSAEIMFEAMPVKSVVTCTAIISGYASNGDVEAARKMFDRMGNKRNSVTWNAMIAGYVNRSVFDEALSLFHLMLLDGKCRPDQVTLISVLSACSHLGSLENGKWISSYINKNKIKLSVSLGNALIDMFAKCGDVESSKTVFNKMSNRCIITWTTMVSGLAVNGMCKEALALFNHMCVQGTKPDDVMFIAVLSACNHGGLVEEGKSFFTQMIYKFGIKPQIEHYGCMIDLLARSGDLDEAVRLTESMDMVPNAVIWGTLIAACKVHGNDTLFEYVTKKVLDHEPSNPSYLTLVTNLSSSIGRWQDSMRFRWEMRQQGIEKVPGCSSIEIRDSVHEFLARDTSHMQRSDIYETLESLNGHLSDFDFEAKLMLCR